MLRRSDERAISPVVGVALLVAVVTLLAAGAAVFILDLTQKQEPQPNTTLDVEADDSGVTHYFVHQGGENLDGDKLTLRGAADPDTLAGQRFAVDDRASFIAVESTITVVYTGEYGTSYTLGTFEAEQTVPSPDEGCDWVATESNGGTEDVKVDGLVVNCDVRTDKVIEVLDGGAIIGDTRSDTKSLDADDADIYGNVNTEDVANVQNATVVGSIESRTADVKVSETSVEGSIDAAKVVEVTSGSSVTGDLRSVNKTVKVLDSDVEGSVVTDGDVKLDDATVEGDVYVDSADFDCTDSTINGEDCGEYSPKDPDSY